MKKLILCFLLFFLVHSSRGQSYIIGYEYWCDTSYTNRVYVSIAPQENFELDTLLGFPGVPKGLHQFHIRFQQINFFWSQTISGYFFKTGEGVIPTGAISAYRYWV